MYIYSKSKVEKRKLLYIVCQMLTVFQNNALYIKVSGLKHQMSLLLHLKYQALIFFIEIQYGNEKFSFVENRTKQGWQRTLKKLRTLKKE